jgi:hypothetical protein
MKLINKVLDPVVTVDESIVHQRKDQGARNRSHHICTNLCPLQIFLGTVKTMRRIAIAFLQVVTTSARARTFMLHNIAEVI